MIFDVDENSKNPSVLRIAPLDESKSPDSPPSGGSSAPFDKRGPRQNVFCSPFVKGESPEGEGDF